MRDQDICRHFDWRSNQEKDTRGNEEVTCWSCKAVAMENTDIQRYEDVSNWVVDEKVVYMVRHF